MGYTHLWYLQATIEPATWDAVRADFRELLAATQVPLAAEDDKPDDPPICDDGMIFFNGVAGAGYETFAFKRVLVEPTILGVPKGFGFCKTNFRPYDPFVCALLGAIADRCGKSVVIVSDGGEPNWKPPVMWASAVLGRTIPVPATVVNRPHGY